MSQKPGSTLPITFGKSDIASANQLEPGWYPLTMDEVTSGPGKKDKDSITWTLKFLVSKGHPMEDTPIVFWISSKMQSIGVALIKCFVGEIDPTRQYNLEELIGKKVQGWCFFEDDGEFRNNKVKDFRPIDTPMD